MTSKERPTRVAVDEIADKLGLLCHQLDEQRRRLHRLHTRLLNERSALALAKAAAPSAVVTERHDFLSRVVEEIGSILQGDREPERRAPVQADRTTPGRGRSAGTISWQEHMQAWEAYAKKYGNDQSAERIAERSGFGYSELTALLGHEPITWEPR